MLRLLDSKTRSLIFMLTAYLLYLTFMAHFLIMFFNLKYIQLYSKTLISDFLKKERVEVSGI
jgi:hypothetical protein